MKAETLGLDSSEGKQKLTLNFKFQISVKANIDDQYVLHPPPRSDLSFSFCQKLI